MRVVEVLLYMLLLEQVNACFKTNSGKSWFEEAAEITCHKKSIWKVKKRPSSARGIGCFIENIFYRNRRRRAVDNVYQSFFTSTSFVVNMTSEQSHVIFGEEPTKIYVELEGKDSSLFSLTVLNVTRASFNKKVKREVHNEINVEFEIYDDEGDNVDYEGTFLMEEDGSHIRVRRSSRQKPGKPVQKKTTPKPITTPKTTPKATTPKATTPKATTTKATTPKATTPKATTTKATTPKATTPKSTTQTTSTDKKTTTTPKKTTTPKMPTQTTNSTTKASNPKSTNSTSGKNHNNSTTKGNMDSSTLAEPNMEEVITSSKTNAVSSSALDVPGSEDKITGQTAISNIDTSATNDLGQVAGMKPEIQLPQIPKLPSVGFDFLKWIIALCGGVACVAGGIAAYVFKAFKCCCNNGGRDNASVFFNAKKN